MQRKISFLLLGSCCLLIAVSPLQLFAQERTKPTAPQLFPEGTLAYLRVNDVKQLKADLERSSLGKLGNDDELKPIISEFYGSLVRNTAEMEEALGLNLDELLSIPSGEMAIALLPNKRASIAFENESEGDSRQVRARVQPPAVAVLIDAGEEISSIQVLLQRMEDATADRMVHDEKTVSDLTLHRYMNPDRQNQQLAYFIDEGTMVACSDANYLEVLAEGWLGKAGDRETLADNGVFTSIMSKCVGTEGERPQISFFVDPIEIVKQLTPRNAGGMAALSALPVLGLNGIEGLGGSWIIGPPDFDAINHFHIQLKNPRTRVLSLLRPKSGSIKPEPWVPSDVGSYATINWDLAATLKGIETLVNQFQGEDALNQQVFARINEQLDIDIRKDVLELLEGRLTLTQGYVKPITINSGSNLYALKLTKPEYFKSNVLPKIKRLIDERIAVRTEAFGPIKAYVVDVQRRTEIETIRQPEICFCVHEDYLLIADSRYMMRELAQVLNGSKEPLAESLEFQLIMDRISEQLQDRECSAISYARPEETLQVFYDLARDKKNQDRLRSISENNGFFKALLSALDKHELPPFSVVAKYLAPNGGFLLDDETGMHYMSFTLRRE